MKAVDKKRCQWAAIDDPLYQSYHDDEWGVPLFDDKKIFEFLTLEAMQAGLSWRTILNKRANFRKAFAHFDPAKVARFNEKDYQRLMNDAGIIRNRLKIRATMNNASRFLEIQREFGSFAEYIWAFVGGKPLKNSWKTLKQIPAKTELAETISKDLKRRGFKFMGPTVVYSHMQATGMVNDHTVDCFRYTEV